MALPATIPGFPPVDYDNYLLWLEQSHYSVSSVGPAECRFKYYQVSRTAHKEPPSFPLILLASLNTVRRPELVRHSPNVLHRASHRLN